MGTIRTTGKARREVEYDRMTINVTFNTRNKRSKDAIKKVINDCETFLEELKKMGIDISRIRGNKNSIEKRNYSDDRETEAKRAISWDLDYDLTVIDAVMTLSEKESYDVDVSVEPRYSRKSELCKELMREAVLDAKEIAEMLATSLGKTIKGPSKINASGDYDYITDEQYIEGDHEDGTVNGIDILGYGGNLFATLQNPTTTQEEEINIEWELEE